jgi:hypothetical protein
MRLIAPFAMAVIALSVAVAGESRAQGPNLVIELEASWLNGENPVQVQSHFRLEQVGVELAALSQRESQVFRGKLGPCAKRIVFRYSGTTIPDAAYYFAAGRMMKLRPGEDRLGESFALDSKRFPAVVQLLTEVQPSTSCGK